MIGRGMIRHAEIKGPKPTNIVRRLGSSRVPDRGNCKLLELAAVKREE